MKGSDAELKKRGGDERAGRGEVEVEGGRGTIWEDREMEGERRGAEREWRAAGWEGNWRGGEKRGPGEASWRGGELDGRRVEVEGTCRDKRGAVGERGS